MVNAGDIHSTGVALKMNGVYGTLNNSGLVLATGLAPAIAFGGNGNTVVNELGGQVVGLNGLAVQGGAGSDHVTNHGRLAGGGDQALDLGGGNDDLTITATSLIDGVSHGGAGFDTLAIGGVTGATFNLSTIGPRYEGFELFRKRDPPCGR